ncbi:AlpA family phage regulatory protein [Paraburkholderia sp. D15]|uniref:helix-turn-helix transcriptional regulator n=1 Tax=Paraburkholderia sp. D15 TaxID=2880218 RepID=UPI002478802C|nr:AlpA family phage regulatory protein [Paraburkholderia sp. D15]WGS51100.1 AlpA family phage regulatory protein [Paraburkholderia sp. D15]
MAIAEAVRPTSEAHYRGIECIVGKLVKHRGWMAPPADNEKWSTPAEYQPVLVPDGGRTLDQLLPPDTDQMSALEFPVDAASPRQLVELPAPYSLNEDDRRILRKILPGLPPLRHPVSDAEKAAFLDAWFDSNERPLWEPILVTAADIKRYEMEQKEIQKRHQQALRDELARGQLKAVDAGYAPVASLVPDSFIPRESAIAYLNRCGLMPDDGDVGVDIERNDQSPESTYRRPPAIMPVAGQALAVEESVASERDESERLVVAVKESGLGSRSGRADATGLLQPTPSPDRRKIGKVARLPRVIELTGLGRSSIYNRMDSHSRYYDPTFPRCFSLSISDTGAVGWDEEQVCAWVAAQAKRARG